MGALALGHYSTLTAFRTWLYSHDVALVGVVEFVKIQTVASDVRLYTSNSWTLNSLSTVSFLSIQLLPINPLSIKCVKNHISSVTYILSLNESVSSRVKSKVCLVHKLLVERRIYCSVVTGRAWRSCLLSFEKFRQDQLLLVNHHIHIHAFTLYCSTKSSLRCCGRVLTKSYLSCARLLQ